MGWRRETLLSRVRLDGPIDAISVATPTHWPALMGIWACQAGKDAYIEKPCCHNIWEGRQLVRAAQRYNRIIQHGTQIRSSKAIREGVQKLHDGMLGETYMARGVCYKWRNTIGRAPVHNTVGNIFYGSKGYMTTGDEDDQIYKVWLGKDRQPQSSVHTSNDEVEHFANFINCVVSRKSGNLHAPNEEGYISCEMMYLANASYRLGRTLNFDPDSQKVIGMKKQP